MFTNLIAGATALAFGALAASGAMANPKNVFSDNNTQTITSAAAAGNDAYSESFNQSNDGVSVQNLAAATVGVSLDISLLEVPILSGNATNAGNTAQNAVGIVQVSANTGMSAINQQGASIGAVGNISFQ